MATTTNYSWTTPDDTALVKDGASAIRSLGTAIDTTTYNNSLLPIVKTIVDAKGDIIAATAADTVARLAVGTNGQVLTADSTAATGLAYTTITAGGMTSLASGSLSGTSVTISSISQTYNTLVLRILSAQVSAVGGALLVRVNNTATGDQTNTFMVSNSATVSNSTTNTGYKANGVTTIVGATSSFVEFNFPNYTSTACQKPASVLSISSNQVGGLGYAVRPGDLSAITSLVILDAAGNTFNGGTYVLYGVK